MVNYVHFLLEGECSLIEHMIVREKHSVYGTHYELYDPEKAKSLSWSKNSKVIEKMDELEYEYEKNKVWFYIIITVLNVMHSYKLLYNNFFFYINF